MPDNKFVFPIVYKEFENIKWLRKDRFRFRLEYCSDDVNLFVMLGNYNICLTLMMYDFVDRIKEDILLDVMAKKSKNNQAFFCSKINEYKELINYIRDFVDEWDISIDKNMFSNTDIISDDIWYSINI